jgi:hypothetical protein
LLLAGCFVVYLALSGLLWWHVWSTHPTSVTTCGCGDPALFLWFLEWPAYALAHGHNPFYSTALFHPGGIDLLSNTSVLGIGLPLAPVTWLFGPVATLNVASTLTPALSALAMCWLLRRWVRWWPSAFIGGLLYGFSPFVFDNLASAHLMTAALMLPPLMVACLDDLLIRRRHRPVVTGAVLGVLVVLQFFIGTEVLVMVVLTAALGVLLLVGYAALFEREALRARVAGSFAGLATAGGVAVVLLAYPAWVALAGQAHLSGLVWPSITPGSGGLSLSDLYHLSKGSPSLMRFLAGYQGPGLPDAGYVGWGALVVVVVGLVVWHRDRRLWFFSALGLLVVILALGNQSYWTPWRVLAKVPVLENAVPGRLMAVITLCAAVLVAIVVDRTHEAAALLGSRTLAALAASAVAALAVVPVALAERANVPFTTRTVAAPAWFDGPARRLPAHRVLYVFPPATEGSSSLAWQAVDGLHFAMATGAGPGSAPRRAGRERAAQVLLTAGASPLSAPPTLGPSSVAAIRRALRGWGVTEVVVAPPASLAAPFDRPSSTAWALAAMTAALGRPPQVIGGSWVWSNIETSGPSLSVTADDLAQCTLPAVYQHGSLEAVPRCIAAAARRS